MRDYLAKRPMLLCGILCFTVSVIGFYSKLLLLISGSLFSGLLIFMILSDKDFSYRMITAIVILVSVSQIFSYGKADTLKITDGETVDCKFAVCEITYSTSNYSLYECEVLKSSLLDKGTKISVGCSESNFKTGDIIKGELKLKSIENSKYKSMSYSKEIYINADLKEYKKQGEDFVLKSISKVRKYINDTIFSNINYSAAATLSGIILGEDRYFTAEFEENIKNSGVSHVMVVSGMHLSVFVLISTYLIETVVYNKYLRAILICFTVLGLIAVCGFTASMLRASITYLLMALGLIFDRKGVPENTLGAAVSVMIVLSPFIALSIGFQLSVLATFGVVGIALPIIRYFNERKLIKNKALSGVFTVIITTFSASLMTAPVTVNSFGFISTVGLITNLLISFAVTVIIWLAVLSLAVNLIFPGLSGVLFLACEIIVDYVNFVINYFGGMEFAVLYTPRFFAVILIALIIAVFYILLTCKNRIDMLKLKEMRKKIISEGGQRLKWR